MDYTSSNREELPQKELAREDQTQRTTTSPDLELQQTESSRNTCLPDPGPQETDRNRTSRCIDKAFGGGHDDDGKSPVGRDKEELSLWGPGGLLAVPHVKLVLFLGCVVQVGGAADCCRKQAKNERWRPGYSLYVEKPSKAAVRVPRFSKFFF